ncbi:MAG: ArsA family ATPase [bacterium]
MTVGGGARVRIILYTGKGGVGKTSVAAATALRCAELGHRTIVLSTDSAHSLSDSFDTPLAPEPRQIVHNLWGQEIDVYYSMGKYWGTVRQYLMALMNWRGLDKLSAEEVSVPPGMEEVVGLLWIDQHHRSGDYDLIIVDCAPTGETLRLLSLPDVGRWWFERFFPIGRGATRLLGPIARPFLNYIPLPDDETFDAVEELFRKIDEIHRLLTDQNLSSVRLVLNPERMVVKEAQRTYTYLNLFGYLTDAVICNRIIPEGVRDEYFDAWKQIQGEYLKLIEGAFSPLPILSVPLLHREVVGLEMLRSMGESLFGERDPAEILFRGQAHTIEERDGEFLLKMRIPFVERGDISILQSGGELTVQVGSYRRNLVLPRALWGLPAEGAKFEGDRLTITFRKNE